MKTHREQFEKMISEMKNNPLIKLKVAVLGDPVSQDLIDFNENEYRVKFPTTYKDLILSEILSIALVWEINEAARENLKLLGEERFMKGKINTCDPITMISDNDNNYWKDIFWFDQINSELNDQLKRFVPFDLADGFRCVTGFMKEGNEKDGYVISDQLYLNRENEELIPHPFTFEEYLEFLLKAKGYSGLLACYNDPFDEEHKRFMKVMPLLFDDFDKDYFLKLSERK